MAHLHRFFVEPDCPDAGTVALPKEEAHHALNVARVQAGDEVALLDGAGCVRYGTFVPAGKRAANVDITRVVREARPAPALSLAVAWLQRDAPVEEIIRGGTVLGVDRFVFFRAARSQRPLKEKGDKWARGAMEACKQCGRSWLPEFVTAGSLEDALKVCGGRLLVCAQRDEAVNLRAALAAEDTTVIIGPEGDLTETEWSAVEAAGGQAVSLGATVFRTEAAAQLAATLVLAHWGRFDAPSL
jgi:16S rRNA (uracil1498-N3)-methyltransferase